MTTDIVTIKQNTTIADAMRIFNSNNFHHIPVIDEKELLVGILSRTDVDRLQTGLSLFKNPKKEEYDEALFEMTWVRQVMTRDVICLSPSDEISEAYAIFKENKIHALPVSSGDEVVGIVTPLDLLDHFFNSNKE